MVEEIYIISVGQDGVGRSLILMTQPCGDEDERTLDTEPPVTVLPSEEAAARGRQRCEGPGR